jgi:hypothetical protein
MPTPHREVSTVITGASADHKGRWVCIGVAFPNKDGSESVPLDALPVNPPAGRLRTPKPKEDAGVQQG